MNSVRPHFLISSCRFAAIAVTATAITTGLFAAAPASKSTRGVQIIPGSTSVRVEINGEPFTEYFYGTNQPRPYFYPVLGPGGAAMTRNWPLKDVPGEEHDHLHHRSLWYAHGLVNGEDFWTEKPEAGRVVHRGFDRLQSGKDAGVIKSRNDWVARDGRVLCSDERVFRVFATPAQERVFDFTITFHANHGELTLGDTKEAAFALRVAESMRVTKPADKGKSPAPGAGRLITSAGAMNKDAFGKRAAWCDYSGPVDGRTVGIAILDHPSNPRHPTWWFVRDYGLHAANPFGQNAFENLGNPKAGDLIVPAGKSITFRYRVYLHEGDELQAKVAERYAAFAREKK